MKISIVIPIFNAENLLKDCINSALNQTYDNIEIIGVNDGSTDSSLLILDDFKDKIKIIDKKNGGTASAKIRNAEVYIQVENSKTEKKPDN